MYDGRFHPEVIRKTPQWSRFILRGIKSHPSLSVRHRCLCYADSCGTPRVLSTLTNLALNTKEHPVLRGQALEVIPGCVWFLNRGRRTRRAQKAVLTCLRDLDANVRFWACFAAFGLRLTAAVPLLKQMTNDDGVSIMGWTVGYEAGEALKGLEGEDCWEELSPRVPHPYPALWNEHATV